MLQICTIIWWFICNLPNRQNKHTVNYSAYTVLQFSGLQIRAALIFEAGVQTFVKCSTKYL